MKLNGTTGAAIWRVPIIPVQDAVMNQAQASISAIAYADGKIAAGGTFLGTQLTVGLGSGNSATTKTVTQLTPGSFDAYIAVLDDNAGGAVVDLRNAGGSEAAGNGGTRANVTALAVGDGGVVTAAVTYPTTSFKGFGLDLIKISAVGAPSGFPRPDVALVRLEKDASTPATWMKPVPCNGSDELNIAAMALTQRGDVVVAGDSNLVGSIFGGTCSSPAPSRAAAS